MKRWAVRLIKVLFVLGIFLGIVAFIMVEYTATSEFCVTCHYMRPYYDAWKASKHDHVPCVECHYPPGIQSELKGKYQALSQVAKYVTGTYGTKPWAEISDRSCLRSGCHERRLLRGKVIFKGVLFDHAPHLTELRRGKRLRCTSCHSQIVQGEHMTVTESTCFLCHFKDIEAGEPISGCPSCHGAPMGVVEYRGIVFDHKDATRYGVACGKCHETVTQGTGAVPRERCFSCHAEPERLGKYDDSIMLHDTHVAERKVECTECHQEIRHQVVSMTESIDIGCTSCHPDHHAAQKELYMGVGGKGIASSPDPMFLTRVSCKGCHIAHKGSQIEGVTSTAPEAACMSCHGVQYGGMLKQWKEKMTSMLAQLLPAIARTEQEINTAVRKGLDVREAKRLFGEAKYNVELVRYGRGVHNIRYSDALLRAASERMEVALARISSSYRPPELPASEVVESECFHCHYGVENSTRTVFDMEFQHKRHIVDSNLPCRTCHRGEKGPKEKGHGTLALGREDCTTCHHTSPKAACETCHSVQQTVFLGSGPSWPEETPDVMAEGVSCADCHRSMEQESSLDAIKQACVDCHEEGYDQMVDEWQEEVRGWLEGMGALLAELRGSDLNRDDRNTVGKMGEVVGILQKDGSLGVHNWMLIESVLSEGERKLREIQVSRSRP